MTEHVRTAIDKLNSILPKNATWEDIELGENTLSEIDILTDEPDWCSLHCILGSFYLEIRNGDQLSNLGNAYLHYQAVMDNTNDMRSIVAASIGLANVISFMPDIDGVTYDSTLNYLEDLSSRMEKSKDIEALLSLLAARANLLIKRPGGDRQGALEEALNIYKKRVNILESIPEFENSDLMSQARYNLGAVYLKQESGIHGANVDAAISEFLRVLELRPEDKDPLGRARVLRALGIAYPDWSGADSKSHANKLSNDAFVEADKLVAKYENVKAHEQQWAQFSKQKSALTEEFKDLESETAEYKKSYLNAVLKNHEIALSHIKAQSMPTKYAEWKGGYGRVLGAYYIYEVDDNFLEPAFRAFDEALQRIDHISNPRLWFEIQSRKGELAHSCGDWQKVLESYNQAFKVGDILYKETSSKEGRAKELQKQRGQHIASIYAAVQLGKRDKAVELAERGLSRSFNDTILATEIMLSKVSDANKKSIKKVRNRIMDLEARLRKEGQGIAKGMLDNLSDYLGVNPDLIGFRITKDPEGIEAKAREARVEINKLLSDAHKDLNLAYEKLDLKNADLFPAYLETSDILELVGKIGYPIIYLVPTLHGTTMLIVPPNGPIRTLTLKGFGSQHTNLLLSGSDKLPGYLYAVKSNNETHLSISIDTCVKFLTPLIQSISDLLDKLGYERSALIPMGSLKILPLHAATIDANKVYHFLPSARILASLISKSKKSTSGDSNFFALSPPEREDQTELPFGKVEALVSTYNFKQAGYLAQIASSIKSQDFFQYASDSTHIHLACHAKFRPSNPLLSAISVGRESDLKLEDMVEEQKNLSDIQLITLSACETAQEDTKLPNESIGFPNTFLSLGVKNVVSTNWRVDDAAALFFSYHFYKNLLKGMDIAKSTQTSNQWLRNSDAETIISTAKKMRMELPEDAIEEQDSLSEIIAEFGLMGSARPFSSWLYSAAYSCYGLGY